MINNIIFDFDGVLVDSEILVAKAISNYLKEAGYLFEEKRFAEFAGKKTVQVISSLSDEFSIKDKNKFYDDVMNLSLNIYRNELVAIKGANDFLKFCNFKIFIGSNSVKKRILEGLKKVKLDKYFNNNQVYSFDMVERPKPHPDIYLKVINENNLNIQETVVIEDSAVGIKSALAAGIKVIGITAGGHWYPERDINELYNHGATAVINSFDKLEQTINNI
tara:strand:+ start:129 stop:788 length:660 start_codon:yes stop_codon:yes gene_type:complete